jgi:hypothetical protein
MLLYATIAIAAGLLLAALVALARHHRDLRERRASVRRFDRWADKGGPRRYRLPTSVDGRA